MKISGVNVNFLDIGGVLLSNGWGMNPGKKLLGHSVSIMQNWILYTISFSMFMKSTTSRWMNTWNELFLIIPGILQRGFQNIYIRSIYRTAGYAALV